MNSNAMKDKYVPTHQEIKQQSLNQYLLNQIENNVVDAPLINRNPQNQSAALPKGDRDSIISLPGLDPRF